MKINFFLLILTTILLFSFVSAESLGDSYKLNETMQITNYCSAGVCSYVTLVSIEYPNGTIIYPDVNMTKTNQIYNYSFIPNIVGTYYFVTCGDSTIDVCDRDSFKVNYNGQEPFIWIHIMFLLFTLILFVGFYRLNQTVDFNRWYSKITNRYEHKDYFKAIGSTIIFFFTKNLFAIYYSLGFIVLLILTDIVFTYNVLAFVGLTENIMYVYSWGVILVAFSVIGQFQHFIRNLMDDITKESWGLLNGK